MILGTRTDRAISFHTGKEVGKRCDKKSNQKNGNAITSGKDQNKVTAITRGNLYVFLAEGPKKLDGELIRE